MKKKLKNNDGMSIVYAITVLLVATILSIVIVGIALNNAQRIRRQREEQQAILAVSSASKYVAKLFDGCSISYDPVAEENVVGYGDSELGKLVGDNSSSALATGFKGLATGGSLEWTITSEIEKQPLDVKVKCSLDNKKNIVAKIYREIKPGVNSDYSMTLIFKGHSSEDFESDEDDITWTFASIDREENE